MDDSTDFLDRRQDGQRTFSGKEVQEIVEECHNGESKENEGPPERDVKKS